MYRNPKVFGLSVLAALVLGAVTGWLGKGTWVATALDKIGDTFTGLLQLTVIPLVFTAIVVGITSLRNLGGARKAARLGGRTFLWFGITSLIAVLIGLAIAITVQPGIGVDVTPDKAVEKTPGSWSALLTNLVPTNIVTAFAEGEVLRVVFIAALAGFAAYALGDKAKPFVTLNQSVFDLVQKVVGWIILLAPIGVFGLIGNAFASYGNAYIKPLSTLIATVYGGTLLVLFVVYPLLLKFVGHTSPKLFFSKSWNAIQFAFVSRSSGATLPLTQKAATDLGVPRDYAGFAVPLATTTKMDGCAAVYPAIATVFIANLFGIELGVWQYAAIVLVAVFGALATAGTTGWYTMLTLTLSAVGMPPQVIATGVAVVYAIDPILDMVRTATNVAGQITVPVLVARQEGLMSERTAEAEPAPALVSASRAASPA